LVCCGLYHARIPSIHRKEKTIEMLTTMGASAFIDGIFTFLGILPLAFSSSNIFTTIFVIFLGLVTLGCAHDLILLPVILSTIGPEDEIRKGYTQELKSPCFHGQR
jgi:Niemann-Pick C1 protein